MNVLLIGIGATTLSALESLVTKCHVLGVVRDINTESGFDDPVINLAHQQNIPIFSDLSQASIKSLLLNLRPECVVVSSYNQILQPELIGLSQFVNVHYSPLPNYRGRANVNWAMINDETYTAITIHRITSELDGGNILFQRLVPINSGDTVADIYQQLNAIQRQYLGETIIQLFNGCEGVPQNNSEATYCCSRVPEDGEINWSASTRSIDCLIRALVSPFPGAFTYFEGKKLTVWHAKPLPNPPSYIGRVPGRVIGLSKLEGYVDVLAGDSVLRLLEVQLAGLERTAPANVIKSVKTTLGLRMSDLLDRLQALEQQIARLSENAK